MREKCEIELAKKLIDTLTIINKIDKTFENKASYKFEVQDMLELIYESGKAKVKFTEVERKTIGALIKNVIECIKIIIFNMGLTFEHNHAAYDLIIRSGLQFMLDNFNDFPVSEGETLEKTLKYLKETGCIEEFDYRTK